VLWACFALSIALQALGVVALWATGRMLARETPISLAHTFFAGPIAFVANTLPTPGGGLGVGEAVYEEALALCAADGGPFARVAAAGLAHAGSGHARMAEAMEDEGDAQATALAQKIGWINLLATVSPSLGLLGTVQGMIVTFLDLARSEYPHPSELAGGIMVALLTTFEGLCVAIPCSVAFVFLRGRAARVTAAVSAAAAAVLDRFRPLEG
jgi:biopolymer transport protein ExbB